MLSADLDSEIQACLMGRRGWQGCSRGSAGSRSKPVFRRSWKNAATSIATSYWQKSPTANMPGRLCRARRPHRSEAAQDRAEDDQEGRQDHPRLQRHRSAIDRPINWPADYADGAFLIKWIAPILRNLADTPERAAEIHVNEGVCDVFEVIFPPKGTLITPQWPAATNARSFVLLRLPRSVGGRGGAGGRWTHAGGSGDHPLHRLFRHRSRRQVVPVARGARRRLRRPLLCRRQ